MSEHYLPPAHAVKDRIDPDVLEKLYALELEPNHGEFEHGTDSDSHEPVNLRTSPALKESIQRFAQESRTKGKSIDDIHSDALKEYRKVDVNAYTDHVSRLSTSDDPDIQSETKVYAGKLIDKENRRTSRQELREDILEAADTTTRTIGRLALKTASKAGYIGLGVAKLGLNKAEHKVREKAFEIDGKISNWKSTRSYKKQVADLEKQAAKISQKFDKEAVKESKRGARVDRSFERSMKRKATAEKIVGSVEKGAATVARTKRRIGSFAAKMEQYGRTGQLAFAESAAPPPRAKARPNPTTRPKWDGEVHKITSL